MKIKKIKWLIYTVLVGLIPILARLFAWGVTKTGTVDITSAADFIAFGLVLHISNINELEHILDLDQGWKTIQNGISILFIAFYTVLFSTSLVPSVVEPVALLYVSGGLALISFGVSYSIYYHLSLLVETRLT